MRYFRVTKYDPAYRDERGAYTKDEWIGFSDVGRSFEGEVLTLEKYFAVEDAYVAAVYSACETLGVWLFKLFSLNFYPEHVVEALAVGHLPEREADDFPPLSEHNYFSPAFARYVVRLSLRDGIWCKLVSDALEVRFGYDYYMYFSMNLRSEGQLREIERAVASLGLFIEEIPNLWPDEYDLDEWLNFDPPEYALRALEKGGPQ